jgi:hypothetical protein
MGEHFYHRLYAEDGIEVIDRDDSNQDIDRFDDELNLFQYNSNNKLFFDNYFKLSNFVSKTITKPKLKQSLIIYYFLNRFRISYCLI